MINAGNYDWTIKKLDGKYWVLYKGLPCATHPKKPFDTHKQADKFLKDQRK